MVTMQDVDPGQPFRAQIGAHLAAADSGPVTVVNTYLPPEGGREALLAAYKKDSDVLRSHPGFIAAQMYEGTGGNRAFVTVAVWESAQHLAAAVADPEFQKAQADYPDGSIVSPLLARKMAVEGICVA